MTVEAQPADRAIWYPRHAIYIALQEDAETQAELAEKLGWEASKLSKIITGKAKKLDLTDLLAIAAAQGRPLEYYTKLPVMPGPQKGAPLSAHNPRDVVFGRPNDLWGDTRPTDSLRPAA